ncbi:hypothetical protein ACIP2Y_19415 [Streptomyces sviceus]|uniref:hypothetical protein n=1 Tax=Streptomyces sviceus TaxID=285530 RepID=UPI003816625D
MASDGIRWLGFGGALPQSIEQLTASGGVFAITGILVQPHPQDRDVVRRSQEVVLPLGERTTARLEGLAHDDWTRWPG